MSSFLSIVWRSSVPRRETREKAAGGRSVWESGKRVSGVKTRCTQVATLQGFPHLPHAPPRLLFAQLFGSLGARTAHALRLCLPLRRSVGPWMSRLPRQSLYLVPAPPSCPHRAALTLGERPRFTQLVHVSTDEELTPSLVRPSEPACSNTAIATLPTGDWISRPVSGQCGGRSVRLSDNTCSQRAPPRMGAERGREG